MPVRVGKPGQGLTGLTDSVESPRIGGDRRAWHCTAARQLVQGASFGAGKRRSQAVEKWVMPVQAWLQDFF